MNEPKHIAVMMDGNGRWAKKRGLPVNMGHKAGAETLRKLLDGSGDFGFEFLTVYAFSSENWQRSEEEVTNIMGLLRYYLKQDINHLDKHNVRVRCIGEREKLDADIQEQLNEAEARTANNTGITFSIAISYGSQQEIARAARHLAAMAADGAIDPSEITEERITEHLDSSYLPKLDLLIRTGGEQRLSNFLLWQSAYTELYFTETLWPDFSIDNMREAVDDFQQRERRFGKRTEKTHTNITNI